MPKYKTIFSLKIRLALRDAGFEPLMETNNQYKPHLKCWVYEETERFQIALDKIMEGRKNA